MQDNNRLKLNLQLFAEGGDGGAGDGAATGENGQAAADNGQTSGENTKPDAAAERKAQYDKFKADFKAEYDAEVQGILNGRLKKARDFEKRANEYRTKTGRILETIAAKYDLDPSDVDGIAAAVDEDNSYFEDEALERGMDVKELRHLKRTEAENKRIREEQAFRDQIDEWNRQAQTVQQTYPQFNLREAMDDDQFRYLANKGVDLKTAFEITHKDEVIAAAMKYASDQTAEKMRVTAQQNAARPDENARQNGGAVKTGIDPGKMNLQQLEEYFDRARRGERITFR